MCLQANNFSLPVNEALTSFSTEPCLLHVRRTESLVDSNHLSSISRDGKQIAGVHRGDVFVFFAVVLAYGEGVSTGRGL